MDLVWTSLETEGRSWKQLYKSLTLIDFLIKQGSERVVEDCRDHLRMIRPLTNYNFWEEGTDKGAGVCDKAKQIIELLNDNARIRTEREKCSKLRNKLVGISNDGNRNGGGGGGYGGGGGGGGGYGNSGIGSDYSGGGGGGGGGSYGNSGIGSDYNRNGDRDGDRGNGGRTAYGGGTYDSSNPNRFSDDSNSNNDNTGVVNKTYDSSTNRNRDTWTDSQPTKASGGKLRVAIKPTGGAAAAPASKPAPEVDFFGGDDFSSAPSQPAAPAAPAFDPFGDSAPAAPAPAAAPAFDPFGGPPPAPAQAPEPQFDPFTAAPAVPPQPVQNDTFGMSGNNNMGGQGAMNNNMSMNNNMANQGGMNNNMANIGGMNNMGGMNNLGGMNNNMGNQGGMKSMGGGLGMNNNMGMNNNAAPTFQNRAVSAPAAAVDDEDFGGFEAAPSKPAPAANKTKGAFGGLVDLDNFKVSANAAPAAAKKVGVTGTTSFNGIDGFSGVSAAYPNSVY